MQDPLETTAPRLGAKLVHEGLCTWQALILALAEQKELSAQGMYAPVGQILVKKKILSQDDLQRVLQALQLGALSRVRLFQSLSRSELNSLLKNSEAERQKGEKRQMHTLFGTVAGSGASVLGLLSVADQGTLVIDQIESLTRKVQLKLADFLCTGRFVVPESTVEQASSVKIIATCHHNPMTLVQSGLLEPQLYDLFDQEPLNIPPLRKRKKDLKLIVDHLIRIGNRRSGKSVQGLEHDAYQRIMAHNWPGNFEELKTTIFRAVALAPGETLSSQDIFIGLKPVLVLTGVTLAMILIQ